MADEVMRLEMKNISKNFGGVHALQNVSLSLRPGEVHALCGENGAGKSTLMKILSGAYSRDAGEIFIDGEPVNIKNPKDSVDHGVSIIYQEFASVPDLTVAENIFLNHVRGSKNVINWKQLNAKAKELLESLGFGQINPKSKVRELTVAYQQIVEICKALSTNCSILILDEPSAVLANAEIRQLFGILRKLRDEGKSIVYISHRLDEVFEICDRITVMKDGQNAGVVNTADVTEKQLVSMMIGRDLESYFPERESHIGDEIMFEVKDIHAGKMVQGVSFKVHKGEVFGLSGLVGAGRTETVRAIFGADKMESGQVFINGKEVKHFSPRNSIGSGYALLPEDRKRHGVLLDLPILYNMTISCLPKFCSGGRIRKAEERKFGDKMVDALKIKIGDKMDNTSSLSGGNQQKVAVSKLIASDCHVYILDEPTRGVDVGAKIEIYKIINDIVAEGNAVIMISSEMPEIIGMCDRVAVMRNGTVAGELLKDEITEQNMIELSMGVNKV